MLKKKKNFSVVLQTSGALGTLSQRPHTRGRIRQVTQRLRAVRWAGETRTNLLKSNLFFGSYFTHFNLL